MRIGRANLSAKNLKPYSLIYISLFVHFSLMLCLRKTKDFMIMLQLLCICGLEKYSHRCRQASAYDTRVCQIERFVFTTETHSVLVPNLFVITLISCRLFIAILVLAILTMLGLQTCIELEIFSI